jgi:putative membrane-bound dehydrogenase-like protein
MNRRTQGGPVDHDLPLLAIYGENDKLRALYVTYACHCVTLSNNKISGDWAGFAQSILEENHPGAVALVSVGCGADQNPRSGVTGDKVDVARAQGAEIAAEARRLLGGLLTPVTGSLVTKETKLALPLQPLPTKEQWQAKTKDKNTAVAYHAKVNVARLDHGDKLPDKIDYLVQTWTFGNSLALVFLPGEVVVDYSLRLKKELDGQRLWVNAYANDAPCYIPSERVLKEGGYEGGGAMVYYDLPVPLRAGLEQKIVDAAKELAGPKFASPIDFKKCDVMPQSPQQSLAAMQIRKGLKVELAVAEPLIASPVAIDFGPDGNLWVAEMADYPLGAKGNYEPGGRIKLLQSSRGMSAAIPAGQPRYDKATVFLDNIPFPTGITAYGKGVLVCAAPDILYAEDTDGDGKADVVKKLFTGFGTGNYQGRVNSLEWGLDGWIYGSCGLFGGTITSHTGKVVKLGDRDFRIKPEEGILEPASGRTQQGRVRDDWDNWFGCDNSTLCRHYPLADHYLRRNPHVLQSDAAVYVPDYPNSNRLFPISKQQLFKLSGAPGGVTAACGLGIYRDDLLGKEFTGNAFVCEPVNNAVHRLVLSPKGATFSGRRAADEQTSEFLASTDPWFRPVQARTGPDGALWIVDMYRYVIEHPRWIPPEDVAKLDLRAGSTMGRIYRAVPDAATNLEMKRPPNLARLEGTQLIATLDSANGWQRDQASQLLLARRATVKHAAIHKLLDHSRPETRVHALCVLGESGQLCSADIEKALRDSHSGVRRHAIRLAEEILPDVPELGIALGKYAADPDPQVRLQLAFTLGRWHDAQAGKLLAKLALVDTDAYLRAAVLSSVTKQNLPTLLAEALAAPNAPPPLVQQLAAQAAGMGDAKLLNVTIGHVLPESGLPSATQQQALAGLLDAVSRRGATLEQNLDPTAKKRLNGALLQARRIAFDEKGSESQRVAALLLVGRSAEYRADDLTALAALLTPQTSSALQAATLQALSRFAEGDAALPIIAAWKGFTPGVKSQALDLLFSRESWQMQLLTGIESKRIAASDVDTTHRQQLLASKNKQISALASKAFAGAAATNRRKVLDEYRDALTLPGDAKRGHAVYQKNCAACHRLAQEGHAVGPDLAAVVAKPPQYLLIEILDPSRNLDSRYVEYMATTTAGRSFTGLLAAETATSITLRGQEGKQQVLLRGELEELSSTGRSLMPEGLEKEISPQAMADLLAFLASAAVQPTPKRFAGNQPATVRPVNGALALLASSAEIYGGDIAFEGKPFDNIGYWHGADDHAVWRVQLDKSTRLDVWLDYACDPGSAGNRYVIEGATPELRGQIASTGGWDKYRLTKIGTVMLDAGSQRLMLRSEAQPRGALLDLRAIYLTPEGQPPATKSANGPGGQIQVRQPISAIAKLILDDQAAIANRQAAVAENVDRAAELIAAMTADLEATTKDEYRRIPWIWRVAIAAGKRNDPSCVRQVLEVSLPMRAQPLRDWQAVVVGGGIINGLSLAGVWPARSIADMLKEQPALRERWQGALEQAAAMAENAKVPAGTRYDALRMIALDDWQISRPLLEKHLQKDAHPELQMGAVSGLADVEQPEAAKLLLNHAAQLTPGNRKLALDGILKTDAGAALLLSAMELGRAAPTALTKEQRENLLHRSDASIRQRARKLLKADQ